MQKVAAEPPLPHSSLTEREIAGCLKENWRDEATWTRVLAVAPLYLMQCANETMAEPKILKEFLGVFVEFDKTACWHRIGNLFKTEQLRGSFVTACRASTTGAECWDLTNGLLLEYFLAVYNNQTHPLYRSALFTPQVFAVVYFF